jgi:hypothetical protein
VQLRSLPPVLQPLPYDSAGVESGAFICRPFQSKESQHWEEFQSKGYLVPRINTSKAGNGALLSWDGGDQYLCESPSTVSVSVAVAVAVAAQLSSHRALLADV